MLAGMKKELSFYPNVEFRLKDAHDNSAVQKQQLDLLVQRSTVLIEQYKANITAMIAQKDLALGALQEEAKVLAQLIAGFASSVNYSAGIGYNEGLSASVSTSYNHSIQD